MALGLKYGRGENGTEEDKQRGYFYARKLMKEFEDKFGGINCIDLLDGLNMLDRLPLQMQLENTALKLALEQMKGRERYIFLAKVLDERSFEELAEELGMGYKGVAAAYYRALEKIRKEMRGEEQ